MTRQHHFATAVAEIPLADQVKEIVQKMFAAGEVEIEMDDAAIKADISAIRSDLSTAMRNQDAFARKLVTEANTETSAAIAMISAQVNSANAALEKKAKSLDAKLAELEAGSGTPTATPAVFDEATVKRLADETFQTLLTKSVAASVASGDVAALPEIKKVDPFFVENSQSKRIGRAIIQRRHLMASGPSGSGKTFPIEQMLRKFGRRYLKVSVADGLSYSDFVARPNVRSTKNGTETYYTYGFLPYSMKAGIPLVLDEIDQCQSEVVSIINSAAEDRQLYVPQTGEMVKAGAEWQIFMTCNSLRDSTGNYGGFRINAALLNRLVFGKADYLKPAEEIGILVRCGLADTDAQVIVMMLQGLRQAYYVGKLTQAPSTRLAVRIARCLLGQDDNGVVCDKPMKLIEAVEYCFLDGLPDNEAAEALTVIKNGI
jgi:MoxR-like ATPase